MKKRWTHTGKKGQKIGHCKKEGRKKSISPDEKMICCDGH